MHSERELQGVRGMSPMDTSFLILNRKHEVSYVETKLGGFTMLKRLSLRILFVTLLIVTISGSVFAWSNNSVTNLNVYVSFIDPLFLPDTAEFYVTSGYTFTSYTMTTQQTQVVFQGVASDPSTPISEVISDIDISRHLLTISGVDRNANETETTFSGISAVATATDRNILISVSSGHWIGADFPITGQLGYSFYTGYSFRTVSF